MYAEYKGTRHPMDDELREQFPIIKEILKDMGVLCVEKGGYEADDIIGTMAKKAEREGFITYMMTTDKDYGQLVSENIFL